MNIIEATRLAIDSNIGITNPEYRHCNIYLLPTNTDGCYFIVPISMTAPKHVAGKPRVGIRWNPHASDILREDWEIYSGITEVENVFL